MACKAIRDGDEMFCPRCVLRWAVDDPERPPCSEQPSKRTAIPKKTKKRKGKRK